MGIINGLHLVHPRAALPELPPSRRPVQTRSARRCTPTPQSLPARARGAAFQRHTAMRLPYFFSVAARSGLTLQAVHDLRVAQTQDRLTAR
jgi:hypothetical protein